jgi:8-amino-7-oxononanoate synthase
MERVIEHFLIKRRDSGLLRKLTRVSPSVGGRLESEGRKYVNFSSNDYLGISSHPRVLEAARAASSVVAGTCSSRLITGSTAIHHQLERKTAEFKGKPAAMLFNSGYQANVGVISSLCGRGDCVFFDRLDHASIIDGIKLSGASLFRFRHNDVEHLEELVKKKRGGFRTALIVTETVFSMDGDIAPLEELVRIKEKHDCVLMVDEAHATGIFGRGGSGVAEEKSVTGNIDIIMGTFSKALGSFGAYIAVDLRTREYLVNNCRSFIYSTALPPSVVAADIAAIEVVRNESFRRETLLDNAEYLRDKLRGKGMEVRGASQIVPVIIGDNEKALSVSKRLKKKGWWVTAVRPPTVPVGEARLRISLSYDHARGTLERFIEDLDEAVRI